VAGRAPRCSSVVFAGALALVHAVGIVASGHAAQDPPARRSIWDGVYTELQANRGEREYGRTCEHCHGPGLEGDAAREIPPLVSDPFMRSWRGKNLKELFDLLSRSMPADNRGSLSARTYTDLIAYLLRVNDVPAGASALPDGPAGLEAISIDQK
jgi:cytochrome c553